MTDKPTPDQLAIIDVAFRLAKLNADKKTIELVVRIINLIDTKGGEANMMDVQKIESEIESKYAEKESIKDVISHEPENILDKNAYDVLSGIEPIATKLITRDSREAERNIEVLKSMNVRTFMNASASAIADHLSSGFGKVSIEKARKEIQKLINNEVIKCQTH